MKKLVCLGLIAGLFMSSVVRAGEVSLLSENENAKSVNITVNPLGMLIGLTNVGFDFKVSSRSTIGLEAAFATAGASGGSLTAFGGGARYTYYLTGEALTDSWYVSPYVYALPITASGGSYSSTVTPLFVGGIAGYHWLYKNGFNMMFGAGAHYATIANSGGYAVLPTAEFRVGYAF